MLIPKEAVKYFVVNHENDSGRFKASPAKSTVQIGNKVVQRSVALT